MPNLSSVIKSEITRIARKELRAEVTALKKPLAAARSETASMKRRIADLEKSVRLLTKAGSRSAKPPIEAVPQSTLKFSAKALATQRERLGLTAKDCGLLVGASQLSIYKWEAGRAKPQERYLPAIAALKSLGKRQVAELLDKLREGP